MVANQDANPHQATIDLLGAAFVVNRTAEGIDEIAVQLVGVPVTSVELMTANVLIHGALGDETGNTLDDVATAAINAAIVARRLNNAKLDPVRLHRLGAEERALDDAPVQCLTGKDGFRLPGSPAAPTDHRQLSRQSRYRSSPGLIRAINWASERR